MVVSRSVQNADTTKLCNEKGDITSFMMKKWETMNFCSAKMQTLQNFVMKKGETTKFCSEKSGHCTYFWS